MGVDIIESFKLGTDKPLDDRYVVDSIYDVSLYWHAGMQVYQLSNRELYVYDASRGKMLSATRTQIPFGRTTLNGGTSGYLTQSGATHSSTEGYRMPFDGTILGSAVDNANVITRNFEIRINNITLATLSLTGQKAGTLLSIDQDFSTGDILHVFSPANTGNNVSNATATIEIAWR